ncbi:hypothetical protein RUM43_012006 [Polyplax serrata]|uniref:Uncharacterized protein n=1 Tax=Polyplax serrata TaxID=468196 RepID=A0AAN8RZL2_POLSC
MLRALRPLSASSSGLPPGFQVPVPCSSPRYGGICKSKGTMKIQKSKSKFQTENGDGHEEDETAEIQLTCSPLWGLVLVQTFQLFILDRIMQV